MDADDQAICPRCRHTPRTRVALAKKVERRLRRRSVRARCGADLESGRTCPCRSRFHAL